MRIVSDQTMIEETYARVQGLAPPERVYIGTTADLLEPIRAQLPEVPSSNYIVEPVGRDTGPAIAYAALTIRRWHPDAVMVVLSADHVIRPTPDFQRVVRAAAAAARETHGLITMGVRPSRPETGYGYIKPGASQGAVHAVERFTEKPDRETAARFVAEGNLWNSGMFVWEVSAICEALRRYLPDIYDGVQQITAGEQPAAEVFEGLRRVSIDFGVMEKAQNAYVVEADFLWDDLGSWTALERVLSPDGARNVVRGDFVPIDAAGCVVHSDGEIVAAIGVEDLVIVKSGDVVLVCRKEREQEIKGLVNLLKADTERKQYL